MGDRLDVEGGLAGERPEHGEPVPNRADAAYAELVALREEAIRLGLQDVDGEPLATLRRRVEQARQQS